MSTKSRVSAAALLVVALLTVSGCASAAGDPGDTTAAATQQPSPEPTAVALTPQELAVWQSREDADSRVLGPGDGELEYAAARRDFPLPMPEGTAIPATPNFDFYVPDGTVGRGMGAGLVSWTWLCATETELVDALEQGDERRAANTFAQLEAWMALPADVRVFEGLDAYRSVVVDPARAGDTEPLATDRDFWCTESPFQKL